jgi:Ca-activated chloride channel family protein
VEFTNIKNSIYFLIPILVLITLILAYQKRNGIIKALSFDIDYRFKVIKPTLMTMGILLIAFSLLNPQILKGYQEVEKSGLDMYLLIDISKSMLAEDIKPNRLERTKKSIENLIDSLEGDRVGFIPFSSDSYVQMPLTDDYDLAKMFLEVMDTDMIAGGGTNIASALKLAKESFDESAKGDKVVVIFSDGEEHNQSGIEVAENLGKVKVYTVGVGTEDGALIPEYDSQGNRVGYKRDQSGKYVNSKLNISSLREIAESGGGKSYLVSLIGDEIEQLIDDISKLKRDKYSKDKIKKFIKIYQYFLATGLFLFLLGYLLPEWRGLK